MVEDAIMQELEQFLVELGVGFSFVDFLKKIEEHHFTLSRTQQPFGMLS